MTFINGQSSNSGLLFLLAFLITVHPLFHRVLSLHMSNRGIIPDDGQV
jgi:hypothetical protein